MSTHTHTHTHTHHSSILRVKGRLEVSNFEVSNFALVGSTECWHQHQWHSLAVSPDRLAAHIYMCTSQELLRGPGKRPRGVRRFTRADDALPSARPLAARRRTGHTVWCASSRFVRIRLASPRLAWWRPVPSRAALPSDPRPARCLSCSSVVNSGHVLHATACSMNKLNCTSHDTLQ